MGSAAIFNGTSVKLLKSILDFNGGAQIHSGTADPSSSATSATRGSVYLNNSTNLIYIKTDSGSSTNWVQVVQTSGTQTIGGSKEFTSPVYIPDGSVSAPGLAYSADTNSGLLRVAPDEIGVAAGGTSRLNVTTSGIKVNNNTTSDSNLGTISSVTLGHYYEGSFSITFTSGFASNTAVTVNYRRVGKIVTLTFPQTLATGANPGVAFCGSGALPSSLQPTIENYMHCISSNSGTTATGLCLVRDNGSGGTVRIYRNPDLATAFTTSATIGWLGFSVTYIV